MNWRRRARRIAREEGLRPDFFERQIGAESNFNPHAKSPAGALGIAQITPATAQDWGVDPMDPDAALRAAARNMARYVKKYGEEGALRAYNAGEGAIEASKGYAETNAYVAKILGDGPRRREERGSHGHRESTGGRQPVRTTSSGESRVDIIYDFLEGRDDPLAFSARLNAARPHPAPDELGVEPAKAAGKTAGQRRVAPGAVTGRSTHEIGHELDRYVQSLGGTLGSGVRSQAENAAAGGAEDSDHLPGGDRYARDVRVTGRKAEAIGRRLARKLGGEFTAGQINEFTFRRGKRTYRAQLIYGTPDHQDHLHFGIRAV